MPYPDLAGTQVSRGGKGAKAGPEHTEITGWGWEPLSTPTKHTTEDLATALQLKWQEERPGAAGDSINHTVDENSKYFRDSKLKVITELNEGRKGSDSNEIVLRHLTKSSLFLLILLMSRSGKAAHRQKHSEELCIRVFICTCACVCMFSVCVYVYAHMHRSVVGVGFLITHSPNILSVRQALSLNLQVTDFADRLAKTPLGTILSPCLQRWDHRCVLPYHDQHSSVAVGNHTRAPVPAWHAF